MEQLIKAFLHRIGQQLKRWLLRRPSAAPMPEGFDFFAHVQRLERRAERETDQALKAAGKRAPRTYEQLGTVLLNLDCVASCFWQCRKGDHLEERLLGRVVSAVRAAFLLMTSAYYDEALASLRNAGEAVNLLFLFERDPASLQEWKTAEGFERWNMFKPSKVRKRLAEGGGIVPLEEDWYGQLSRISTHVEPETNPQAHNLLGVPTLGGYFQIEGALLVLNEIARVAGLATFPAARLILEDQNRKLQVLNSGKVLLEEAGSFNLDSVEEYRKQQLEALRARPRPEE